MYAEDGEQEEFDSSFAAPEPTRPDSLQEVVDALKANPPQPIAWMPTEISKDKKLAAAQKKAEKLAAKEADKAAKEEAAAEKAARKAAQQEADKAAKEAAAAEKAAKKVAQQQAAAAAAAKGAAAAAKEADAAEPSTQNR